MRQSLSRATAALLPLLTGTSYVLADASLSLILPGLPCSLNTGYIQDLRVLALVPGSGYYDNANTTIATSTIIATSTTAITSPVQSQDPHDSDELGFEWDYAAPQAEISSMTTTAENTKHTGIADPTAEAGPGKSAPKQKVHLDNGNPEDCPTDIDTPHCDQCGGIKAVINFSTTRKAIAEQSMRLEDCPCEDVEDNHSCPLKRTSRAERLRTRPGYAEEMRFIEEEEYNMMDEEKEEEERLEQERLHNQRLK